MERRAINLLTIVLLGTAILIKLSDASCDRDECNIDADCTGGRICLGPDSSGNKTCFYCNCNENHECELDENDNVWCNCANSNGYYGRLCECQPSPPIELNDTLSLYGACDGSLTEEFETLNDTTIEEGNRLFLEEKGEVYNQNMCTSMCVNKTCYAYTYGYSICKVYSLSPSPINVIQNLFRSKNTNTYIRKCESG